MFPSYISVSSQVYYFIIEKTSIKIAFKIKKKINIVEDISDPLISDLSMEISAMTICVT